MIIYIFLIMLKLDMYIADGFMGINFNKKATRFLVAFFNLL